jgi:hypothetical protein
MAELRLQIGPITASITATDAAAQRVLQAMLRQYGHDLDAMSNQEQADMALSIWRDFAVQTAGAYEANEAAEAARQGVVDDPPGWR